MLILGFLRLVGGDIFIYKYVYTILYLIRRKKKMNTNTDGISAFQAWKAANKDFYSKDNRRAYFHKDKTTDGGNSK